MNNILPCTMENLELILDSVPLNLLITDIDGKIMWCNQFTCNFTGYSKEEIISNNPRILQSEKTPKELYIEMWDTIKNKQKIWSGTLTNKKKDGSLYEEALFILPLKNEEGKLTRFFGIQQDVTELNKLRKKETLMDAIKQTINTIKNMESLYQ